MTINYTHDSLNRLTEVNILLSNENAVMNYTYDAVGNRTMMVINSNNPALVWYNEYGPTLDEVPFINKPMQVIYDYNEIDQLTYEYGIEVIQGNASPYEIYYNYDADGNMVEKELYKGWSSYPPSTESAKVTTYTYDVEDKLTGILFPNNQTNAFYDCICGAKQMEWTDANGEVVQEKRSMT